MTPVLTLLWFLSYFLLLFLTVCCTEVAFEITLLFPVDIRTETPLVSFCICFFFFFFGQFPLEVFSNFLFILVYNFGSRIRVCKMGRMGRTGTGVLGEYGG